MAGSWHEIPPPPGKAYEQKIHALADLSDMERKISQTLSKLPEELLDQFVGGVRNLLLNGRVRLVRADELIGKFISGVDRSAAGALKTIAFNWVLKGLDELCCSALRAADGNSA